MPGDRLHRVEEIFSAASDLPGPERARFVETASGGDAELEAYVLRLLAAHETAGGFLRAPTLAHESLADGPAASDSLGAETSLGAPGELIGPYRLIERIGEGGFGTVFLAEQQAPVVRRVALKVIKLGMDTRHVIARFEAERQALAMMDHPNIARVLDAGATAAGRPYFVMELVRGDPITKYCDDQRLTTRERLQLFQQVCHAVQHAHHKGIVHRDIKPSNVLVTVADGHPIAKMIDFGIAKATLGPLTEKTILTGHLHSLGTPMYMSPEQAGSSGTDVDTRSDVYGLGVLLYELLTGTTPFDSQQLRSAPLSEVLRIIREVDPQKPSSRVQAREGALAAIAERRRVAPPVLRATLRGDLDWIVMKAMEKDRARRYQTTDALAEDLERHLRSEPVGAAPPSVFYIIRRFARRHRVGVLVGGSIAAALALGVVGTTAGMLQAIAAQDRAEHEAWTGNLAAASAALSALNSAAALRRLDLIPEKRRDWVWRCLHRQADVSIDTFADHTEGVRCLAVSPDGSMVASGSDDKTIKIWDAATGAVRRTLTGMNSPVSALAWSRAGTIASGGEDGWLRLWDPVTGEPGHAVHAHRNHRVQSLDFSRDGTRIVTAAWDGWIKTWDAASREQPLLQRDTKSQVHCIRFSPDGEHVAAALNRGRVWLLDAKSESAPPRPLVDGASPNTMHVLAFSPDGARLAAAAFGGSIQVCDVATGRTEARLAGAALVVLALAFAPDGRLTSAGTDGVVRLWDPGMTEPIATLLGHVGVVTGVAFSRDGTRLFSCSKDKTLKVWEATAPGLRAESAANLVATFGFSSDGTRIGAVYLDGSARLWDSLTGGGGVGEALIDEPVPNKGDLTVGTPLAFDHAGLVIAFCVPGNAIELRDADTGEPLRRLHGHTDVVRSLAFAPKDTRLVSAGFDGTVRIWDVHTGTEIEILERRSAPCEIVFSPDGSLLALGTEGGVVVWDASSWRELWRLPLEGYKCVAFSPDSSRIACCAGSGTILLCAARTGEQSGTISGLGGRVTRAAFSADGTRLLSVSFPDTSIRVWDTATLGELVSMQPPSGGTHSIAFSPDGTRLAQATGSGRGGGIQFLDTVPEPERFRQREALRAAEPEARRVFEATLAVDSDCALVARRLREDPALDGSVRRVALHMLLAHGLAEQKEVRERLGPLRKDHALPQELVAAVRDDASFPEHLRATAMRRGSLGSQPSEQLNRSAWAKVESPGGSIAAYRRGLSEATEAVRLAPHDPDVVNTLGVAQYRVGDFEAALTTLARADAIRGQSDSAAAPGPAASPAPAPGNPVDVAFLAMTQHRLGREQEAAAAMARLEALMGLEPWRANAEARACQAEAVSSVPRR